MEPNIPSQSTPSMTPETQTPVIQPVQPTPNSSSNKTKYVLLGLLILLIIAAVGGGTYYLGVAKQQPAMQKSNNVVTATTTPSVTPMPSLTPIPSSSSSPTQTPTPTTDPTANWKIYTSSQYGYSIKYPSTITYKQDRFYLLGDDNRKDTADGFGPELEVLFRSNNSTPLTIAKQELQNSQFKNFDINNATGVQEVNPTQRGFDYYVYPKSGSGNVIRLLFNPQNYSSSITKESIDTMQAIAVQMIATFKFTQ